jgi:hypothetical protein
MVRSRVEYSIVPWYHRAAITAYARHCNGELVGVVSKKDITVSYGTLTSLFTYTIMVSSHWYRCHCRYLPATVSNHCWERISRKTGVHGTPQSRVRSRCRHRAGRVVWRSSKHTQHGEQRQGERQLSHGDVHAAVKNGTAQLPRRRLVIIHHPRRPHRREDQDHQLCSASAAAPIQLSRPWRARGGGAAPRARRRGKDNHPVAHCAGGRRFHAPGGRAWHRSRSEGAALQP